jgi:hypothetical protein
MISSGMCRWMPICSALGRSPWPGSKPDPYYNEQLTRALAAYVSPGNPVLTLDDNRNGRGIASYGPFQAFKLD